MTQPALKPILFGDIAIGQELGPISHNLTAEMVRRYAEATGDSSPEAFADVPVAPPSMATIFSTRLMGRVGIDRPAGSIHAKQEYSFLAPIPSGQVVTTTGKVVEKFEKRGRLYVVFETLTVDARNRPVSRCRVTSILAA